MAEAKKTVIHDGKHLRFVKLNGWEYVERKGITGIVTIVAVTDENKLLLIEQFRPPVGRNVLELPAGLAGDVPGESTESLANAANRELLEETGFAAEKMTFLCTGVPSAGLCDEVITLFKASGVKRKGVAHGDGTEQITLHEVPLKEVPAFLAERTKAGVLVDYKVYAGLYFLKDG